MKTSRMSWNRFVQTLARLVPYRRGIWTRFLRPGLETHSVLFGKYRFEMDLSQGFLQKIYFLKPNDYEPETLQTIRHWVKPGMTVLDIGANTGYLTLLLADLVGPQGHVYSFEPFPNNFTLLEKNIKTNNLSQIQFFSLALSNRKGTAFITRNPMNDGGHSMGNQKDNPDHAGWDLEALKTMVSTTTLDDFVAEHKINHVDFIKIDVEGAESLVFDGAKKLLSQPQAPVILCEVADIAQRAMGQTEASLRKMLYDLGYTSYWLRNGFPECSAKTRVRGLQNLLFRKIPG